MRPTLYSASGESAHCANVGSLVDIGKDGDGCGVTRREGTKLGGDKVLVGVGTVAKLLPVFFRL